MQPTRDLTRAALGVSAALLIATPNVTWVLYLPSLLLWLLCAYLQKPRHDLAILGSMYLGAFCVPTYFLDPATLPYNALFFSCLLFALLTFGPQADDVLYEEMIRSAPYILLFATLLPMVVPVGSLLQSRPEGVQLIDGLLRQRGLYSEPGFLGHWATLFLYLNLRRGRTWQVLMSMAVLGLSASAGAMLFLLLLVAATGLRVTKRQLVMALLISAGLIALFFDQIMVKLSSGSMVDRVSNFAQTIDFLHAHNFVPLGFGPMNIDGAPVGVLSFGLGLLKAMGWLALPMIAWIFWRVGFGFKLLAILVPWIFLGNYWETPVLVLPLLFLRSSRAEASPGNELKGSQ